MKIDAHVHLSSPDLISGRAAALKGEPGLEVLYSDPKAPLASTSELLSAMDKAGVAKALVMGFAFRREDNARRYNEWLLEECSRHKGRLYPLCSFDPRAPFGPALAKEFLDSGGFGLGELCVYDEGLTPSLLESLFGFAALCRERGAPLLVHVNEPIGHKYPGKAPIEISQIYELIKGTSGTKLILAHFGGGIPFFATLKKEVREAMAHVRFDTAAMPYIFSPQALGLAVQALGASSFLFGTDYPLLAPERYYKYFNDAGLGPEDSEQVLGLAAKGFLGL
ncbi:MAG: amidohydrolase [Deltaproteobacteria bacterium]|nr:amidohydrolase [Deltaproteobacteria bacterium]